MTIDVKICGLSTAETMDAALDAGADHVGLVVFPPSPRHVDPDRAAELAGRARGRAGIVVLTVDADNALLAEIMDRVRPDILQLHGHETPERVAEIRARHNVVIWKAVPVADAADVEAARAYAEGADRILFDAKPPRDATRPGGNARAFDWTLLTGLDLEKPFVLSGGLDAGNVGTALTLTRAPAVDVSSGVESTLGVKDADKIRAFVRAARAAAHAEEMAGQ
jgi:phosphoribosylanthranilate isomerase